MTTEREKIIALARTFDPLQEKLKGEFQFSETDLKPSTKQHRPRRLRLLLSCAMKTPNSVDQRESHKSH